MKRHILKSTFLLLFISFILGCSKSSSTTKIVTPSVVVTPVVNLLTLPPGWKLSSLISDTFPTGIQLYYFDTIYSGRKTKMFCLAFNAKNNLLEFKPVLSTTAKKLSDFNKDEGGKVLGCVNGGYFGGNQSYSLVKYNGASVSSPNIKILSRTFNGIATSYYPTRAAFGINTLGDPNTAWIYHVGSGNDLIYQYPSASNNMEGAAPMPIPSDTYPTGATIWNVTSAIGGSPMILSNGNPMITDIQELISINNTTSRPRTAIGYTSNNIVVILLVEGDNPSAGYDGMNLVELAGSMKALGCTNAINLDGGGSSSMIAGNQLLNRPSDGSERSIVSAILIKQR